MRRAVYLARHGETDWNRDGRWQGLTDTPLNDTGRTQAVALAEALRGYGIRKVRASHLRRAQETAEIVASILGLAPIEADARLCERGYGCFEGLTRAECRERFPEHWERYHADPSLVPPGGEAQPGVMARMREAIHALAAALPGDDEAALAISHGGAIRAFIASVTAEAPPPLKNGALFRVVVSDGQILSADPIERSSTSA